MRTFRRKTWKIRSIGSCSGLLVLAWIFLLGGSVSITFDQVLYFIYSQNEPSTLLQILSLPLFLLFSFTFPLASLLAEVVISRYKLVSYSLKALWILSSINCVLTVTTSLDPEVRSILQNVQLYITLMPQVILFGAFLPGAVPLGTDQIIGGTAANISSFILWFIWAILSGVVIFDSINGMLYHCSESPTDRVNIILSLLSVFLLSVNLMLDFFFNHKLVKEPVTVNPVTLICKVLKYAAKHKYPVRRSAFTYCDDDKPTRLDYGKVKYGGPFTTEQVEDVKTFWRMSLVIFVMSLVSIPLQAHYASAITYLSISFTTSCVRVIFVSSNTQILGTIMFAVPLYELFVYPCLRKRSPKFFQSSGIAATTLVFLSIYGLSTEIMEFFINGGTQCPFSYQHTFDSCLYVYLPYKVILGLATVHILKWFGEFVSAQSPYNMKGIHIGLTFSLYSLFLTPGAILYKVWQKNCNDNKCGIWFFLNVLIVAVVSLVLHILVIRWYKPRERDEISSSRNMVEEVYTRYQEQERQERLGNFNSNTINA